MTANGLTSFGLTLELLGFVLLCLEWNASQRHELLEEKQRRELLRTKIARLRPLRDEHRREIWFGERSPAALRAEFETHLSEVEAELEISEARIKEIRGHNTYLSTDHSTSRT